MTGLNESEIEHLTIAASVSQLKIKYGPYPVERSLEGMTRIGLVMAAGEVGFRIHLMTTPEQYNDLLSRTEEKIDKVSFFGHFTGSLI